MVVLTAQPLPVRSFDAIRWPHPWFVSRVAVIRDPRIGPGIGQFGVSAFMPRRLQDLVVFAAPGVFVVLCGLLALSAPSLGLLMPNR